MIHSHVEKLYYPIPSSLKDYVSDIIVGESKPGIHEIIPVHPNGFPVIIYSYNTIPILHFKKFSTTPKSRLNLGGQIKAEEVFMEVNGQFGQLGLVLFPTASYYLFHKQGAYFLNCWKDLQSISAFDVNPFLEKLAATNLNTEHCDLLFSFLTKLLPTRKPKIECLDTSIETILNKNGIITQEELTSNIQLSARHFRRKFKEIIGVSPKYFCKIIQLNTIFELLKNNHEEKLHHLAIDCGYYDQAHFINDFKNFIGQRPKDFLNGEHEFIRTYLGRRSF